MAQYDLIYFAAVVLLEELNQYALPPSVIQLSVLAREVHVIVCHRFDILKLYE